MELRIAYTFYILAQLQSAFLLLFTFFTFPFEKSTSISIGYREVNRHRRPADQRKALLRGLTTQLIREGRVTTTKARAKALRDEAERMITLAKEGSLSSRRRAIGYIYDKQLVHTLFEKVILSTDDTPVFLVILHLYATEGFIFFSPRFYLSAV